MEDSEIEKPNNTEKISPEKEEDKSFIPWLSIVFSGMSATGIIGELLLRTYGYMLFNYHELALVNKIIWWLSPVSAIIAFVLAIVATKKYKKNRVSVIAMVSSCILLLIYVVNALVIFILGTIIMEGLSGLSRMG